MTIFLEVQMEFRGLKNHEGLALLSGTSEFHRFHVITAVCGFLVLVALLRFVNAVAAPLPCRNYSSPVPGEVATLFTKLIRSALDQPGVKAIDTYATAAHWQKTGEGWITSYANCGPEFTPGLETIGGDSANDMIFVMLTLDFNPAMIVEELSKTFTVTKEAGTPGTESQTDKYSLSYQGDVIGQVWLEYSSDHEHHTGGTAVFYSRKKLSEIASKANTSHPIDAQ